MTDIAVNTEHSNIINTQYSLVMQSFENELAKGANADFTKIMDCAYRILGLANHLAVRGDSEDLERIMRDITAIVKKTCKTYNDTTSVALTVASAIVSIVGGLMCMLPLTGTLLFSTFNTTLTVAKAGGGVTSIGQALGSTAKMPDEKMKSEQTALNGIQDVLKQLQDKRRNQAQQAQALRDKMAKNNDDANASLHQAKSQALTT